MAADERGKATEDEIVDAADDEFDDDELDDDDLDEDEEDEAE